MLQIGGVKGFISGDLNKSCKDPFSILLVADTMLLIVVDNEVNIFHCASKACANMHESVNVDRRLFAIIFLK